ncbi:MAG: hypothetical protein GEU26_11510 [Nitrososphaeraceae archaeon]|nr:hypothetical protein [Nitrososphaeraceae archaeon]
MRLNNFLAISCIASIYLFTSITPVQSVESQVQVTDGGTGISIYTEQNGVYTWLPPESFSSVEFVVGLNSGNMDGYNDDADWTYYSPIGLAYIPLDIYQDSQYPQSYAAGYYQGFLEGYLEFQFNTETDVGDAGAGDPDPAPPINEEEFFGPPINEEEFFDPEAIESPE